MPDATATPELPEATILLFVVDLSSHTSRLSLERLLFTDTMNSVDLFPRRRFSSSITARSCAFSPAFGLMWSRVGILQQTVTQCHNMKSRTGVQPLKTVILISSSVKLVSHRSTRLKNKFIPLFAQKQEAGSCCQIRESAAAYIRSYSQSDDAVFAKKTTKKPTIFLRTQCHVII